MRHVALAILVLGGCASQTRDDPASRCETICTIDEPSVSGAYDVCSSASAQLCVDQCESRIANVELTCASCLLEYAEFSAGPVDASADCDASNNCTVEGHGGRCTYRSDDQAQRDQCLRTAFPRREIGCSVNFQDARNCAGSCP